MGTVCLKARMCDRGGRGVEKEEGRRVRGPVGELKSAWVRG